MSRKGAPGFDYLFKILLLGDSSVGKTSLMYRFCDDSFSSSYISTTGIDFKIKTLEINGKTVKLQIWDTAGQERFQTITQSYYRGAMGILLIYDVTSLKSFESLQNWVQVIQEHANPGVEKLMIGNKCELTLNRIISRDKAEQFAEQFNLDYMETSAREDINVKEAFILLGKKILDVVSQKGVPKVGGSNAITVDKNLLPPNKPACCSR